MGKTEAFLLPLLDTLYSRPRTGPADGVRALVLYPMNALVNDQVERLHGWMKDQDACRLFHFTSETPEDKRAADKADYPTFDDGSRLRTRREARDTPPDVLVTNYSMLEYMLIRPQDAPFFGRDLSVVVLDEMHLYSGTLAAEIALLLRRVLLRCGLRHEDVMWLGASATLGGDLREFGAALFSRSTADVHVLEGTKARPELADAVPPSLTPGTDDIPDVLPATPFLDEGGLVDDVEAAVRVMEECGTLAGAAAREAVEGRTRPAQALAGMLTRAPLMHRLQDELWRACSRGDLVPLGRLASELWGTDDGGTRAATERLLRLGARARWKADELPLFPHKMHFLVRSPVAPMVCVNLTGCPVPDRCCPAAARHVPRAIRRPCRWPAAARVATGSWPRCTTRGAIASGPPETGGRRTASTRRMTKGRSGRPSGCSSQPPWTTLPGSRISWPTVGGRPGFPTPGYVGGNVARLATTGSSRSRRPGTPPRWASPPRRCSQPGP